MYKYYDSSFFNSKISVFEGIRLCQKRLRVYYEPENKGQLTAHEIKRNNGYQKRNSSLIDELFKEVKKNYDKKNIKPKNPQENDKRFGEIRNILKASIEHRKTEDEELQRYLEDETLNHYIDVKKSSEIHSIKSKIKRFGRKVFAHRNKITYWFTQTWDPDKFCSEEEFIKSFDRFKSNLADRYGVKFLGAYESGDDNNRKHFHGFIIDPNNYFKSENFANISKYSTKKKKRINSIQYLPMCEKFGFNDFVDFREKNTEELVKTIKYTSEYSAKSGERFYYSRGLPDSAEQYVDPLDLYFKYDKYKNGLTKYFVCEDVPFGKDNPSIMPESIIENEFYDDLLKLEEQLNI